MSDVFKEYAIEEGVTLGRIKNDLLRQTYVCKSDGCTWKAHGCRTIDKKSFIIKTLDDKHDFYMVYNNSEAKVKWIVFRVKSFVKSNSTVSAKLLGDLLLKRRMVMRKLQERNEECNTWRDVLPPRVNARILKNNQSSI
ncbi:hypothetical protein Ddye_025485 [Dipteronia dyeriana]|uniref:Transposase MuDR plant domain-containing protein n=1 Tax=Dipteronia dyeriana TaxID=168575 RepID=A0AAD9TLF8_9ROSI|nr:hypothetical protein Ddye_025485 [Dipteronia dyeriana]